MPAPLVLLDHRGQPFAVPDRSTRRELITEAGAGGVNYFSGILSSDEFNAKLTGSQAIEAYDKMRRSDAQVAALLNAISLPILSAQWNIQPPKEAPEDFPEDVLDFARDNLFSRISFEELLRHALSSVWAGFAWFEKVYAVVDGQFQFKDISPRLASTLYQWEVDTAGNFRGLVQRVRRGDKVEDIPLAADKVALFTFQQEANNYEGMSLLRPVYKHWFIKDALYRIDAIRFERFGIGVPVITLPAEFTEAMLVAANTIGKNWRGAEQSYLVKFEGMQLEIVQMEAGKALDLIPTIKHHNEEIAKAGLAQFLNFGTTQSGSRALSDSTMSFFYDAEESLAKLVARTLERQLLWPLMDLNFPGELRPRVVFSDLGTVSLSELVESLSSLGEYISKDLETENYVRDRLNMPLRTEEQDKADRAAAEALAKAAIEKANTPDPEEDTPEDAPAPEAGADEETAQPPADKAKAHQHGPGCGHAIFARSPGEVVENEEGWWRPLRPVERYVALRQIGGKLDDTKDRVVRVMASVRDAWAAMLVKDASLAITQGPAAIDKVALPASEIKAVEDRIRPVMMDLWAFGRDQVRRELDAQAEDKNATLTRPKTHEATVVTRQLGAAMFRDEDISAKDAQSLIASRVKRAVAGVAASLQAAVHTKAMGYWRTQGPEELDEDEAEGLIEELGAQGVKASRYAAAVLASEALSLGRDFEAQRSKEQIDVATLSALLDNSVCENCEAADGVETDVGSSEYYDILPPLQSTEYGSCLGGNFCRCIVVYNLAE